jgi:putative holliday junction resolvase
MKILALDLGDVHTGTALSDSEHIIANPFKTVPTSELRPFLKNILATENISTVVVGYPKTLKGTESIQTKKTVSEKEILEDEFKSVEWALWDERLSSKQAARTKPIKNKADKLFSHSIAAAIILNSYLEHLKFKRDFEE